MSRVEKSRSTIQCHGYDVAFVLWRHGQRRNGYCQQWELHRSIWIPRARSPSWIERSSTRHPVGLRSLMCENTGEWSWVDMILARDTGYHLQIPHQPRFRPPVLVLYSEVSTVGILVYKEYLYMAWFISTFLKKRTSFEVCIPEVKVNTVYGYIHILVMWPIFPNMEYWK